MVAAFGRLTDSSWKKLHHPQRQEAKSSRTLPGELRLHELQSRIFRNTRMLRVWLPPGYSAPENQGRHYPVFYLNDGQNLFDPATAYIGVDWQADEAADRLIRENRIPPLILVGIDNAQKDRAREYLPYRSFNPPVMRPQGKRYPDFLLNEVMPFLYQHYRIARGPENTGLGGSSLGAIISLYTAMAPARNFRPFVAGESVFICLQPATCEIQPRLPAVAGTGFSWRWEPTKREARIAIGR